MLGVWAVALRSVLCCETEGGGANVARVARWGKHYHSAWRDRAHDQRLDQWLRVTAAAYGGHRANGHALFERGELARITSTLNLTTGELTPNRNLSRHIAQAVDLGFLVKRSNSRCLIVPGHAVDGGLGDREEECPVHRLWSDTA